MDEVHRRRGPSALTVADLVATLGTVVIRAVPNAAGLGNIASGPVIFDPMDELPDSPPGGVLLMVGLAPDSPPQVGTLMPAAAKRGYSALVVKARGQPLHDVADAAKTAGIALLVVDEAVPPWRHLDRLIVSVTSSHSRNDHPNDTGGGDLFVLANAIATALKGAVAIEDLDRNVLAYSNLEQHKVDRMRRIGILARRVPPEMDKHIRQYRDLLLAEGGSPFPPLRPNRRRVAPGARLRSGPAVNQSGPSGSSRRTSPSDPRVRPRCRTLAGLRPFTSSKPKTRSTSNGSCGRNG